MCDFLHVEFNPYGHNSYIRKSVTDVTNSIHVKHFIFKYNFNHIAKQNRYPFHAYDQIPSVISFIHVEWMKFQVQMNFTFHALKGLGFPVSRLC
jgi:hypothetical protein